MTPAQATAKTILIAAEPPSVRDRFKSALEDAGHHVLVARSAAEVLGRVRADLARLDLLVLDLRLPHGAGVEIVKTLRKIDAGKLPVLVFSGSVASADEVKALAALGVGGYVNEYSAVQHILPTLAPHLYPSDYNRRGSPRVVLGIPISYRVGNTTAAALTLNLSHGGVAIRTTSPPASDARVRVRFRLPGSKRDIDAEAGVCWSSPQAGMGLQFLRVAAAAQAEIDEFVDAHFFRTGA